jgi:hypothetical protein
LDIRGENKIPENWTVTKKQDPNKLDLVFDYVPLTLSAQ